MTRHIEMALLPYEVTTVGNLPNRAIRRHWSMEEVRPFVDDERARALMGH